MIETKFKMDGEESTEGVSKREVGGSGTPSDASASVVRSGDTGNLLVPLHINVIIAIPNVSRVVTHEGLRLRLTRRLLLLTQL